MSSATEKPSESVHEKTSRINVLASEPQRQLIKQAARVSGTSMSEFILMPAVERAANVLASEQVTRLNADIADRFTAWLDEPAHAIAAMKRLTRAEPFDACPSHIQRDTEPSQKATAGSETTLPLTHIGSQLYPRISRRVSSSAGSSSTDSE